MLDRMSPRRFVLALILLGCSLQAQALRWRVCLPDSSIPPLIYSEPGHDGLIERLLVDAGRQVGLEVELQHAPPGRCLALLEGGSAEAALAPPTERNRKAVQFPMHGTQLDAGKYLFHIRFLLIGRRGWQQTSWNGKSFGSTPLQSLSVGTRRNFSAVIEFLGAQGVRVDAGAATQQQVLEMLVQRRFDLAALMDHELRREPELPTGLVVLEPPLLSTAIFAVTGPQAWAEHSTRIEAWWNAIARLRDQPAYRAE